MENRKLTELDFNVTDRCNFRCIHCGIDAGTSNMPEPSLTELEKILKDTKELGGEKFEITGGEPLLRKDIEEIIKIGKNLGYKTKLNTNGLLLTRYKLERFKELGLDGIAISLDGSNPETYNRIRQKDKKTFEKIVDAIRDSKTAGFYTKINTVASACNLEDLSAITELALSLSADEQAICYFTPIGRGSSNSELSVEPAKWLEYIRTDLSKYKDKPIKLSLRLPLIEEEHWNPGLGCLTNKERNHLQIFPDGNAYPCAILASYGKPIANLHECSIKDIWNNDRLWTEYWKGIAGMLREFENCCVNFKEFKPEGHGCQRYKSVCPFRRFGLDDIK